VYILPTSKTSFYRLLSDGNIIFRIYSRQLHQRIPSQIGEACLKMTDILKSETFIFCNDIEILYKPKIPECQIQIGVLKVTVQLGSKQRHFNNNFLKKLSIEGLCTETLSNHETVKPSTFRHKHEASLKPMSNSELAPGHHASSISRRIIKNNRSSVICHNMNNNHQFCKNCEEVELRHRVADSLLSETSLNEVIFALLCTC
jgi:ribosomal protein L32